MTHRISVDSELHLAAVRAWGPVDLREFLEYRASLASHESFTRGMRLVIDLREADFTPTHDEVRSLIASSPFSNEARIAVVVADDLHFGLARMWSAVGAGTAGQLHPFRSVAEACEWLGAPMDRVTAMLDAI